MNLKLKLGLPLLQLTLALGLLVASDLWEEARPPQCTGPEASPALKWLLSIDIPVVVPVVLLFPHLPNPWSQTTLFAAIGLLWYWVALTLVSWQERRTVSLFSFVPLRLIGDFLSLGYGVYLISLCCQDLVHSDLLDSWSDWVQFLLRVAWSFLLILPFGWDFIRCMLGLRIVSRRPADFGSAPS